MRKGAGGGAAAAGDVGQTMAPWLTAAGSGPVTAAAAAADERSTVTLRRPRHGCSGTDLSPAAIPTNPAKSRFLCYVNQSIN